MSLITIAMTILLGVSSSLQHSTPEEWAAKHVALGLKCVNFPVDYLAGEDVYMAYKRAADEAGLVINDIISKANGEEILTSADLVSYVNRCGVGDSLELEVYRDGKTITVKLVVGEKEESALPSEDEAKNIEENNNKIKAFDNQLSYESDGQISLVVPDRLPIEKQITGQMNIVDVLSEWENLKRRKELRQNEETKQSFMEKTGRIFADYEDSKSDTIIAQIEQNKRRLDRVLPDKNDKPFDATAALNKTYSGSIWDEVNKAIEEDNR